MSAQPEAPDEAVTSAYDVTDGLPAGYVGIIPRNGKLALVASWETHFGRHSTFPMLRLTMFGFAGGRRQWLPNAQYITVTPRQMRDLAALLLEAAERVP